MIDAYLDFLRSGGASENTIYLRRVQLLRLEREVGSLVEATAEDLVRFLARRGWARETRRSHRSAVASFYRWAFESGLVERNPATSLPRVKPVPPHVRPVDESVFLAVLAIADPRERLMLRLAGECGLRRGEVAAVHCRDMYADLLGWSLVVHGKGGRDRIVPLPDSLAVEMRASFARTGHGWLFPSSRTNTHVGAVWVGKIVRGLLPEGVTMHQLRHRFATVAYRESSDILAVQKLLGHATPTTTQRYVALPDERLRKVASYAELGH